jgi:hypothetical protein
MSPTIKAFVMKQIGETCFVDEPIPTAGPLRLMKTKGE